MRWLAEYLTAPSWRLACVANSTLLVIWGTAALIFYWSVVDTAPPISDVRGAISGRVGNSVWVEWRGTLERSCPGRVRGWVINGHLINLPPQDLPYYSPKQVGERVKIWYRIDLPETIHAPARHQVQYEFWCNPLQRLLSPIYVNPAPLTVLTGDRPG